MTSLYDSFAERFGTHQADLVMDAATSHKNGIHDKPGSDSFRWAILICLGSECLTRFRESHKITAEWQDVQDWIYKNAFTFAEHDGDVDFLCLFCGHYDFICELTHYSYYKAVVQAGIAALQEG
jgi:hypothetical protein